MTPAAIIKEVTADGVRLALTPTGTIKATGDREVLARWLPLIRENKPGIVAVLQEAANEPDKPEGIEYTPADLAEMDRLLTELSKLEGWNAGELDQRLDERRRMAPVNVLGALYALRAARNAVLAGWPEDPLERAQVTLCRFVN